MLTELHVITNIVLTVLGIIVSGYTLFGLADRRALRKLEMEVKKAELEELQNRNRVHDAKFKAFACSNTECQHRALIE